MEKYLIFVINPGSTSTKLELYENDQCLYNAHIFHDAPELLQFKSVNDQLQFRMNYVWKFIEENNIDLNKLSAIVGRGGSSYSVESGVYEINDLLINDTKECKGGNDHASNLGVQMADELRKAAGCPAYMSDPICVDELCDSARYTGIKGLYRKTASHCLNMKGTARLHAKKVMGKSYEECNFVVAHIDGGITVSAHKHGRQIDCNNGAAGEGSFTPTRIGTIAARDLLDYAKGKDIEELKKLTTRSGGFVSHFGTSNADVVHKMIEDGDPEAKRVWDAMIYNVGKQIGSMAVVLEGKVDAILLTGGLLRFPEIEEQLRNSCGWIAPIYSYEGEVEDLVMADAAVRVLSGQTQLKNYTGKPCWQGFED